MKRNSSSLNPYHILDVSQAASKAEITKAVGAAMKRKEYSVQAIAEAQKSLLDSKKRIIADYLRPILPTIKRFKRQDFSALNLPTKNLTFLPEFDKLETTISEIKSQQKHIVPPIPCPLVPPALPSSTQNDISKGLPSKEDLSVSYILKIIPNFDDFKSINSAKNEPPTSIVIEWVDWLRIFGWAVIAGFLFLSIIKAFSSEPQSLPGSSSHTTPSVRLDPPSHIYPERRFKPTSPSPSSYPTLTPVPITTPSPTQERANYSAYSYNFPMNSCGDQDTGENNLWYPVYVDYSESNLSIIRNSYCADAIKNWREIKGFSSIQVASFISYAKAQEFANIMRNEMGSGEVGETYSLRNSSIVQSNPIKTRVTIKRNQFPLSSCGDSNPGGINTWYPVNVEYSESNLIQIRTHFCQDAYKNYIKETGNYMIQVGSFLNREDAQIFANFMRNEIGNGEVGTPTAY